MEVLAKPEVQMQMKDTKAAEEVLILDRFFNMLNVDEHRAVYGVSWFNPGKNFYSDSLH
jgi:stalled ribosome rescue protein Dom34